jgi:hypothetical protein
VRSHGKLVSSFNFIFGLLEDNDDINPFKCKYIQFIYYKIHNGAMEEDSLLNVNNFEKERKFRINHFSLSTFLFLKKTNPTTTNSKYFLNRMATVKL